MNLYLLSVGINKYLDKSISNLSFAEKDATDVYNLFSKAVENKSLKGELLTGEQATLQKIKFYAGEWLPNEAKKEDSVIFYFAGHGAEEFLSGPSYPRKILNYIVPFDASAKSLYASAFSLTEDLPVLLKRIPSEHITIILDCCFSGGSRVRGVRGIEGFNLKMERLLSVSDMKSKVLIKRSLEIDLGIGKVLLLACAHDQYASESEELRNGVFTHFIIEVISNNSFEKSISTALIYDQVSKLVETFTNGRQTPVLEGHLQKHKLISF